MTGHESCPDTQCGKRSPHASARRFASFRFAAPLARRRSLLYPLARQPHVRSTAPSGRVQVPGCGVPSLEVLAAPDTASTSIRIASPPTPCSADTTSPPPGACRDRSRQRGSAYTHRRGPVTPCCGAPRLEQCAGHPKLRRFRAIQPYTLPARIRAPGSEKRRPGIRPAGSNRRTSSTARAPSYRTPQGRRSWSAPSKASSGTPRKRALAAGSW